MPYQGERLGPKASPAAGAFTSRRRSQAARLQRAGRMTSVGKRRCLEASDDSVVGSTREEVMELLVACERAGPSGREAALRALRRGVSCMEDGAAASLSEEGARLQAVLKDAVTSTSPEARMEAVWTITNITAGSSACVSFMLPLAPLLVPLLKQPDLTLLDQAAWALGNIAADSAPHRHALVRMGAVLPLLRGLETLLGHGCGVGSVAWALSMLLQAPRQGSDMDVLIGEHAVRTMCNIATMAKDTMARGAMDGDGARDVAWMYVDLIQACPRTARVLGEGGGLAFLTECLGDEQTHMGGGSEATLVAGARGVALMYLADESASAPVLQALAARLTRCIAHASTVVAKEATLALSNIAADGEHSCQVVVDAGAIAALETNLRSRPQCPDLNRETCYCIMNISTLAAARPDLIALPLVSTFVKLATSVDSSVAGVALSYLEFLVQDWEGVSRALECKVEEVLSDMLMIQHEGTDGTRAKTILLRLATPGQ